MFGGRVSLIITVVLQLLERPKPLLTVNVTLQFSGTFEESMVSIGVGLVGLSKVAAGQSLRQKNVNCPPSRLLERVPSNRTLLESSLHSATYEPPALHTGGLF